MFLNLFITALPIIAGCTFRTSLQTESNFTHKKFNYSLLHKMKTVIILVLLGFFMNMLTWGMHYTFSWNILQLVGLSLIIIAVIQKYLSIYAIMVLGILALFLAEPLRHILQPYEHIYFISIFTGADNRFIFWSFFPWFSLLAFGYIFTHYYLKSGTKNYFMLISFITGLLLLGIAVFRNEVVPVLDTEYIWGPSLFLPKIGIILASLGFFLITLTALHLLFNKFSFKEYGIINCFSKGILWIYIFHIFASYKLSFLLKMIFPVEKINHEPINVRNFLIYLILPIIMLLSGWLIGFLTINIFHKKRLVITLKKSVNQG
jgi:hypothetical protein